MISLAEELTINYQVHSRHDLKIYHGYEHSSDLDQRLGLSSIQEEPASTDDCFLQLPIFRSDKLPLITLHREGIHYDSFNLHVMVDDSVPTERYHDMVDSLQRSDTKTNVLDLYLPQIDHHSIVFTKSVRDSFLSDLDAFTQAILSIQPHLQALSYL